MAAGCTVVLKPSEIAPLDAFILAEIIDEIGLPAGVFNMITGTGPVVGEAMSAHTDIDMMSFTGSTRVVGCWQSIPQQRTNMLGTHPHARSKSTP